MADPKEVDAVSAAGGYRLLYAPYGDLVGIESATEGSDQAPAVSLVDFDRATKYVGPTGLNSVVITLQLAGPSFSELLPAFALVGHNLTESNVGTVVLELSNDGVIFTEVGRVTQPASNLWPQDVLLVETNLSLSAEWWRFTINPPVPGWTTRLEVGCLLVGRFLDFQSSNLNNRLYPVSPGGGVEVVSLEAISAAGTDTSKAFGLHQEPLSVEFQNNRRAGRVELRQVFDAASRPLVAHVLEHERDAQNTWNTTDVSGSLLGFGSGYFGFWDSDWADTENGDDVWEFSLPFRRYRPRELVDNG